MVKKGEAIVTFDLETGKVKIEAVGFEGEGCFKALEWLESEFPRGKVEKKKDFYQRAKQKEALTIKG